jgi:hypothetical protein
MSSNLKITHSHAFVFVVSAMALKLPMLLLGTTTTMQSVEKMNIICIALLNKESFTLPKLKLLIYLSIYILNPFFLSDDQI